MVNAPKKPAVRRAAGAEKNTGLASPPTWIEPCIPTLVDKPPSGTNWRHEVKWDGYRLCVVINEGKAKVRTRRGHDWTHRFTPIAQDAAALPCRNAVLDGEAVILDAHGRADFTALQDSLSNAIMFAFDLLFLDGRDLRPLPLRSCAPRWHIAA